MIPPINVLALIPARSGSKSIPRKNVLPFAGHPLIAYSIAAGLAAGTVTRVIVSSDNDEIAAVSRRYGADVPFTRPAEHAQDDTPDLPVFQHALHWLAQNEDYHPDIVVQLRPTSPLRRVWHIDQAVMQLIEHPEIDAVRTVCEPFQNPFKMWTISNDGRMHPLIQSKLKEAYNMPRQLLPEVYWQTGYVDAVRADIILENTSMTGDRIAPLVIDANDWIDIDSPEDWARAERLLEEEIIALDDLGFQVAEVKSA